MTWRHDPSLSVSRAHISHDIAALVVGAVVVVVVVCHICAVNEKMRDRSEDTGQATQHMEIATLMRHNSDMRDTHEYNHTETSH